MGAILLIIGSLLMGASLVIAFIPRSWAGVAAWGSLLCFHFAFSSMISTPTLIFWAIAVALVLGIDYLRGISGRPPRVTNAYITAGSLVGAVTGAVVAPAALIPGAILGAFLGLMAWSRTPSGRVLAFPSREFWQLLLILGLPAVVVMSILGQVFTGLFIPA